VDLKFLMDVMQDPGVNEMRNWREDDLNGLFGDREGGTYTPI
jgi:hypothetical protein